MNWIFLAIESLDAHAVKISSSGLFTGADNNLFSVVLLQ